MIRNYACQKCKAHLFTGSLKALLSKRRKGAPHYIEMTCPNCRHTNRLTHDPNTELRKAQSPSNPLPSE